MAACSFVDVKYAADVGAEDLFEGPLHGDTAEMQDRVDAFDQLVHRLFVGKVAEDDFFAIINGRGESGDVRQAQDMGIRAHTFAQDLPRPPAAPVSSRRLNGARGIEVDVMALPYTLLLGLL